MLNLQQMIRLVSLRVSIDYNDSTGVKKILEVAKEFEVYISNGVEEETFSVGDVSPWFKGLAETSRTFYHYSGDTKKLTTATIVVGDPSPIKW